MTTIQNNNLSFKGLMRVATFNKGKQVVKEYSTTIEQDRIIKMVANGMAPNGAIGHSVQKEDASAFTKLIEMIMGEKLKGINDEKLMTNGYSDYVAFGDIDPLKTDGIFVNIKFDPDFPRISNSFR